MSDVWISIDPGDITGIAILHKSISTQEGSAYDMMQVVEARCNTAQAKGCKICLVLEGVTLPRMYHLPAKEFGQAGAIDVVHYLALKYNAELISHIPVQRKVITRDMLKRLGWYFPSPDDHMIDACQHLAVARLRKHLLNGGFVWPVLASNVCTIKSQQLAIYKYVVNSLKNIHFSIEVQCILQNLGLAFFEPERVKAVLSMALYH